MQRYHAGSAVNNSAFGRIEARDSSRAESPAVPPNFSLNSRRSSQTAPYKLRCEKEQLNFRLGPPDFHQPTPNCPEETLTRDYAQSGYRETVEGLEEGREISFSQVQFFTKTVVVKCKEGIRKCHRAINESRAQKRKAGQVYGVPLSGSLLTKSAAFPELRSCGEDFRKKWIEGLSQPHRSLRSLADHVPHGYKRKSLFEVLIRNNIPLLRATWFVKVNYLNQVRASSSNFHEKTQLSRSELWTKDVIEYLQYLLDEFMMKNVSHSTLHMREHSSQMVYAGSLHKKSDSFSSGMDAEELSLHTKLWYVVRMVHWHYSEGLVVPSLIIDWVLNQLQEKDLIGALQLLLPIIYGFIEIIILSQTYVRTLVGIAIRFIREPSPGSSDLVDNSRRAYTTTAVVELLRYLIHAVPDTFVALDCFPLPACVLSHVMNDGSFIYKTGDDFRKVVKDSQIEVSDSRGNIHDAQAESLSFLSVVSSVKKRTEALSRAARPNHSIYNGARASQVLDQSLMHGDIMIAYELLFENLWDGACAEHWTAQVSPCLFTSLKHMSSVTSSLICSVFFICEWATCEFRDFRAAPPHGMKFSGKRDISQVFIALRLINLKMSNMPKQSASKKRSRDVLDVFESHGPLHDIIVCWIDQHEVHNGEGFKRLQILIRELIQSGVFNPQAYVRQLILSGILDGHGSTVDLERRKRHYKLLKELPAPYIRRAMEETRISEPTIVVDAMDIYFNERRLVLHGLLGHGKPIPSENSSSKQKKRKYSFARGSGFPSSADMDTRLEELKDSISALLKLPSSLSQIYTGINEAQGSSIKRSDAATNGTDVCEETSGCEECKKVKRQKLNDERTSYPVDEEEIWWVGRGKKYMDYFRAEPPPPPTVARQSTKGRQKNARKIQSLAQLADTRIEDSQGASTSHVCESGTGCPRHRNGSGETANFVDGSRNPPYADIRLIGKALKKMRFIYKRDLAAWLISVVKQLIEEAENFATKGGQYGRLVPPVDSRTSMRWKLGEDELSTILYIMDACDELVSATRFLLWLFPKLPSSAGSVVHSRNTLMLPRISETHACDVGEVLLISCIRRYENIITAADLIPETLSGTMHHAAAVLASNGRLTGLPSVVYARHLLRKYGSIVSVIEWKKTFTSTRDKRLTSELESGRSLEGDFGFPFGVPNGVDDPDEYIRQKISSSVRLSRVGMTMKEIVHRHIDEVFQYFYTKDKKPFGSGSNKSSMEKLDDTYQIAKQIVIGLMDCMRQTGGAAQEGDPCLVSSAILAIVNNFGLVVSKIPDLTPGTSHLISSPPSDSLNLARHILHVHISCLRILKEALGDRQSQVFEVALATEASNALVQAFAPRKGVPNSSNDTSNHPNKFVVLGRVSKISGAVSALVIGSILQGVASLERMVSLFRLKEGLDLIQFARSLMSNSNGYSRSTGVLKVDNSIEVSVNWFRVLVGNCRTVADGFIVDLLGEPSIVALSRMQRLLSLNLVFPPAYSVFAFVLWRPILDASFGAREDYHQFYKLLATSIGESIKHLPFREICLRDTCGLHDLIASDNLDSEFVSFLEFNVSDMNLKAASVVPQRSRLFLDALIDCKMPEPMVVDKNRFSWRDELKQQCAEKVKMLITSKLVHVLDTLQPARFHWQWIELRLLLNEQAVNEKIENDISLVEAIRSISPNTDKTTASESEKNFIQIILTRLLVRPDASPLFSEVIHRLGKSLEDSMLSQAKWLLRGAEVLYGKKSIRQKIVNIAGVFKELSLKPQHWKPWGWCSCSHSEINIKREEQKSVGGIVLEEGEVVDVRASDLDAEGLVVSQQHVTERALVELIIPCLDQGSDDLCCSFASEMIKQMGNIEQQINVATCGVGKQAIAPAAAIGNKSGNRKSGKSGIISRQMAGAGDTAPPSPAALRASMAMRLQFLIRLLPIICADREPLGRNMRYALASVILRLIGSRIVHEDFESCGEMYAAAELCCQSLFDSLLLVLHALLSCHQPIWLKQESESKDYAAFDRAVAEKMQADLDSMELPDTIRQRIQTSMPILFHSTKCSISCQPSAPSTQPKNPATTPYKNSNPPPPQRTRSSKNLKTKAQALLQQDNSEADVVDPWAILEDGAHSAAASGGDHSNLKASNLLRGAVRVRRTDLTYVGAVDEDC